MNIFSHLFQKMMSSPGPSDDFWFGDAANYSARITHENAMQVAAVYSCTKVISEAIASLPLVLYRRLPGGGKEEAVDHPLYNLLKYQPNQYQTRFEFMQMFAGHLVVRGNFYAEKIVNRAGQVEQILPLHPGRMQTELLKTGSLRFKYQEEDGSPTTFVQGEVLRAHGLSMNGLKGLSVIESVRDTFSGAKQTQDFANSFFSNGAQPGGILYSDTPLKNDVLESNKEMWKKYHQGAKNAHRVAVLCGLKWQSMGMSNQDSQFLETRKYSRSEICGLFGVPPHMVGDLEKATFSNIEHQDIGFYKQTVRPWLVNIEQSIKRDLIIEDDHFAEFKIDGILRGDTKTRSEYYAKALGAGGSPAWMTQNEVRSLENLNPLEGGDKLPKPTNLPKEEPGKKPEKDDDEEKDDDDE